MRGVRRENGEELGISESQALKGIRKQVHSFFEVVSGRRVQSGDGFADEILFIASTVEGIFLTRQTKEKALWVRAEKDGNCQRGLSMCTKTSGLEKTGDFSQ